MGDIEGIQIGAYILSAISEAARSTAENYGFVLRFRSAAASERVKTYAATNAPVRSASSASGSPAQLEEDEDPAETSFFAFKAMRRFDIEAEAEERQEPRSNVTGRDQVEGIVKVLVEKCRDAGPLGSDKRNFVERKPIIR